jgi:hypothetical protein
MTRPDPTFIPAPPTITEAVTSRMLRASVREGVRPVDDLIERLLEPDGPTWLESRLAVIMPAETGYRDLFCTRGPGLNQLHAMKNQGKAWLRTAATPDERLAGTAAYFLAVAAALRWHRTVITSAAAADGGAELRSVLLDLASALPEPWASMVVLGLESMRRT